MTDHSLALATAARDTRAFATANCLCVLSIDGVETAKSGHPGAPMLLHLTGFEDMPIEELKRFRQWGTRRARHPEYGHAPGVDITSGPLGQGLAGAVGMAMAERMLAAEFGLELVNHRTWVFCGDMTAAIRRVLATAPAELNPRKYLKPAMARVCHERFEAFDTAGQARRIRPLPIGAMARRYAAAA